MNHLKQFDKSFLTKKVKHLAGVDEAGRGPLAGPVVAAAVIFDKKTFHEQINDSKKIAGTRREELYEWIVKNCVAYGIGVIDHIEIDEINILQASLKAMKIAALQLEPKPNLILIDGNKSFVSNIKSTTVVKGDAKSFSIAAASIIAKVTRDTPVNFRTTAGNTTKVTLLKSISRQLRNTGQRNFTEKLF